MTNNQNCKGLYAIIRVVSTSVIEFLFECKSSKEVLDYQESKYNEFSSVVKEKSVSFEGGT